MTRRRLAIVACVALFVLLTGLAFRLAGAAAPPAPMQVLMAQPGVFYAPGGQRIHVPAGSTLDACGPVPAAYDLAGRVIRIAQPCALRPVFSDGFEAAP